MKTRGRTVTLPPDYSEDENLSDDEEYTLPSKGDQLRVIEQSDEDDDEEEEDGEKDEDDEALGDIEAIYLDEDFLAETSDLNQPSTSTGVKSNPKRKKQSLN